MWLICKGHYQRVCWECRWVHDRQPCHIFRGRGFVAFQETQVWGSFCFPINYASITIIFYSENRLDVYLVINFITFILLFYSIALSKIKGMQLDTCFLPSPWNLFGMMLNYLKKYIFVGCPVLICTDDLEQSCLFLPSFLWLDYPQNSNYSYFLP